MAFSCIADPCSNSCRWQSLPAWNWQEANNILRGIALKPITLKEMLKHKPLTLTVNDDGMKYSAIYVAIVSGAYFMYERTSENIQINVQMYD